MNFDYSRVEELSAKISKNLFSDVEYFLKKPKFKDKILNGLMAECMANDALRTQLFRFIDVFPVLKSNESIVRHFLSYVGPHIEHLPWAIRTALLSAGKPALIHAAAFTISRFVKLFAGHFIVDSTSERKTKNVGISLRRDGCDTTFDILGEDSLTQEEANKFFARYMKLIERLGSMSAPEGFTNNISVKLSSLVPKYQWDPINFDECVKSVSERLSELLWEVSRRNIEINIDMEQYATRDLTIAIFQYTLEHLHFNFQGNIGIVAQSYLKDSKESLEKLLDWIKARNHHITIRLVKGAYWDYEVINAEQQGWPIPVFVNKSDTDEQFKILTERILLSQKDGAPVNLAVGSHNADSIAYAVAMIEELGLTKNNNEVQVLYGMGDSIRYAVRKLGHPVRVYVPYGELVPSMAYLVRRLLENTSQQSFLGMNFVQRNDEDNSPTHTADQSKSEDIVSGGRVLIPKGYSPTALTDFSIADNRLAMKTAIMNVNYVSDSIPAVSQKQAELAMNVAGDAFFDWNNTSVEKRASILHHVADIIRSRRFEFAALQVFEVSKTWREADADIAEAIDFLEYYARCATTLMHDQATDNLSGESNDYGYGGRGVAVVISPWNFPMAIAIGMCSAALVTGNTVVFKPATRACVTGKKIIEVFLEAGLSEGVINFVPGRGQEIGETLIKHPNTTNILFTGSKNVGFKLIRWAAEANEDQQTHARRVIAEMGGKNAIIIDDSADLDQAVYGVVKSAFGYQGQKCSACSRVIVLDSIYDEFVERLIGATQVLKTGVPADPGTDMGAVIDENAFNAIMKYIDIGKQKSTLAYTANTKNLDGHGWFIGPHIFTDVSPTAVIAKEEIFGPVLSVIRADDFNEALKIANGVVYHLTGGVYSRTDEHIALARKRFKVGNLYINRNITGAVVGRQPFGGFGASGTGPKAGGVDYLLQLVEPKTVTECLMRRGFSPKLKN